MVFRGFSFHLPRLEKEENIKSEENRIIVQQLGTPFAAAAAASLVLLPISCCCSIQGHLFSFLSMAFPRPRHSPRITMSLGSQF